MHSPGHSSVARPAKGRKSERTAGTVLQAARSVFAASGYERATTAEIALAAGVSEATVFAYFGSKRQLCLEVIRGWYDEISGELEREVPLLSGLRARLQFVVRRHLQHLMGDGVGLCALILGEGRTVDHAFSEAIAGFKRRYVAPLVDALQEAQRTGELREDVPVRLMRDMVFGAMEHVLWGFVASGRKPELDATAQQLTDVFMDGFAARPAPWQALRRFHADIVAAVHALDARADGQQATPPP